MRKVIRSKVALLAIVAVVALGASLIAASSADNEDPITGQALADCSDAALAETGGGEVTDTEDGDEESRYEVEVTKDGSQVDVQLDADCEVVGSEADGDEGEDDDD